MNMKMTSRAKRLERAGKRLRPNLRRGLKRAGVYVQRHIREMISGEGHTRNPGRASPYPGVKNGQMLRTTRSEVQPNGMAVKIGPNVHYGPYLEFGWTTQAGTRVEYPFMQPALEQTHDKALDIVDAELLRGV
jgi:hypothetical protein